MTSVLELSARAALCRQLARREPDSKDLWLAEAERWSHLEPESGAATATRHHQPAGTWCWIVIPKYKPPDVGRTGVRFEFCSATGRDELEELLSGLSAEADNPH
jgi:hypothetical protein